MCRQNLPSDSPKYRGFSALCFNVVKEPLGPLDSEAPALVLKERGH